MLVFTTDKKRLMAHFKKDPVLFAYHIGDLDDFFFPDCLWPTSFGLRGGIDDVLLMYMGGDTPTLLAFGLSDRFAALLHSYLPIAPGRFLCHFQKQFRGILRKHARETSLGTHLKMKLDETRFAEFVSEEKRNVRRPRAVLSPADMPDQLQATIRLNSSHEDQLRDLYAAAYPQSYFTPRMLQTGKFFGYRDNGNIVAVAGVHVVSDERRIAVLGNIATHPDYRGRGLATLVTHRLAGELVSEGKMVCLNVKADNTAAIACYRKLGFVAVHECEEAILEVK